ncbi:MAG: DUF4405 domain-containing protein [Prevotellaceae bacterium]|jgi:hypothetical protein|nr:DUF4405 domain-containing protein [Prevotellaceae bacterium]
MKRAVVSIVLFFDVILLAVTGIVAVFDNLIGEQAEFVVKLIHFIAGLVFMVFAVYHIVYNWKVLKSYLKKKK